MTSSFRLIATPLSHYGRKARILLDLYKVPYHFEDIGNVSWTQKPSQAGENPLLKVPVLKYGDDWIIESDHIAAYIVDKVDKSDIYEVNTRKLLDLNIRAMCNGVMSEEVKIIGAGRHDLPVKTSSYFQRAYQAVTYGMDWLEENAAGFQPQTPKYREFHLICMWDHLAYYDFLPMAKYQRLQRIVEQVQEAKPIIRQSAPFVLKPKAT